MKLMVFTVVHLSNEELQVALVIVSICLIEQDRCSCMKLSEMIKSVK